MLHYKYDINTSLEAAASGETLDSIRYYNFGEKWCSLSIETPLCIIYEAV